MQQYVPDSDIYTVDALYHRAELAAIHLLRSGDRIAIIDTGTMHSVTQIETALSELGLNFNSVDFIILTHIHLDHAGGASALMKLCPKAKLIVHPKGARHMTDPTKLIAGTIAVYGEQEYNRIYGTISPIDANRIIQPKNDEIIDFSGRPLLFIDTPGHANHHFCIVDSVSNSVFTGDTLGVGYQALRSERSAFVIPTTTPVQFNPLALHQSIDRVMEFDPDCLYLTHYSALRPTRQMIASLHEQIDDLVILTEQSVQSGQNEFEATLSKKIHQYLVQRCLNEIPEVDESVADQWLRLDAKLNAQGLVYWWNYRKS